MGDEMRYKRSTTDRVRYEGASKMNNDKECGKNADNETR